MSKEREAIMEKQLIQAEKTTRQILDEEVKVDIEIPEDPNNPDDVVPVGINGVIYAIPRGKRFKVPKSIYEVWRNSHEETKKVNRRIDDSIQREIKIID